MRMMMLNNGLLSTTFQQFTPAVLLMVVASIRSCERRNFNGIKLVEVWKCCFCFDRQQIGSGNYHSASNLLLQTDYPD